MKAFKNNFITEMNEENLQAFLKIKQTAGWLDQKVNEFLSPYKISEQQYNILRILRGAGEKVTVKEVKNRMIQKSPNATRLMDKLCDKKLIERSRCENDRRIVFVKISENGLQLLEKIDFKNFDNKIQNLSEKEAKTLNKLLDKIVRK